MGPGDDASDPHPRSQASETPSSCQDADRARPPPVLASVPNLGPGPGAAPGQRRGRGDIAGPRGGGAEPPGHGPQVLTHGLRRHWADKGSSLGLPELQGRAPASDGLGDGGPRGPGAAHPRRVRAGHRDAAGRLRVSRGRTVLRAALGLRVNGFCFRLQPLRPLPGRRRRAEIRAALGFSWAQGSGSSPQTSGLPRASPQGRNSRQAGPRPCTLEAVALRAGPRLA